MKDLLNFLSLIQVIIAVIAFIIFLQSANYHAACWSFCTACWSCSCFFLT